MRNMGGPYSCTYSKNWKINMRGKLDRRGNMQESFSVKPQTNTASIVSVDVHKHQKTHMSYLLFKKEQTNVVISE